MKKKNNSLVYLPANVKLYQFSERSLEEESGAWSVTRFHELEKPMNVLLLNKKERPLNKYLEVLYNAEKWFVRAIDVYELRS